MTFEEYVNTTDFAPSRPQWAFIIAYDKAVKTHRSSGLLWYGGVASGKTTLLRQLEDYWKQRYQSSHPATTL